MYKVPKQILIRKYLEEKKSCKTISKELNLPYTTIRKNLLFYEIKLRTRSEALKGKLFTEIHRNNLSKNHWDLSGRKNPNWKGGLKKSWGYYYVYFPTHPNAKKNYVKRCNLVMEQKLGRYLQKGEVVHHKNEIKTDDSIGNLQLEKNESNHQLLHWRLRKGRKNIK